MREKRMRKICVLSSIRCTLFLCPGDSVEKLSFGEMCVGLVRSLVLANINGENVDHAYFHMNCKKFCYVCILKRTFFVMSTLKVTLHMAIVCNYDDV